nr:hypothetical protein [Acetatifactor sp.]
MGQEQGREEIIQEYHDVVMPLLTYVPWLEEHAGETGAALYDDQGLSKHTLSFPVFDPALMQFVRECGKSSLMDRN